MESRVYKAGDAPVRAYTMERKTKETQISANLCLDGGEVKVSTGIGFFDHMLHALAFYAGFGLELEARGVELGYFNYVDEDVYVIADAEQMKRVINNIIGNSLKYMDKKKGIINIRILDVGDFVQVEIEDNGKGIGPRELPYIFDRFYRTDSSRNSAKGGSGIGLSIVKKIVEDHGGRIWATSKEGIGTEIHFVLRKTSV